ncbi:adenylyl-sulfate kinase [Sesbania bispinosa]|nr:adenylyl-sulfate kinase [Sesbania bispinosa]
MWPMAVGARELYRKATVDLCGGGGATAELTGLNGSGRNGSYMGALRRVHDEGRAIMVWDG